MNTVWILISLLLGIESVPLSEFFPYGTAVNDQILRANDDESTAALPLPRLFPYFNNNHRQIYLANNGLFSFLGPIQQFTPTAFPLGDNRRLIAGFWSDIDTRGVIPGGNLVYYQIYSDSNSTGVFEKAARYVRDFFPGERSFRPSMVITGTWYRVGAFSAQTSATNTFQIVLATDEIRSFAFLLYQQIQWAAPSPGAAISAQAGFNAGDGVVFEMLPYSRTSAVTRLVNISNVNVPGLFAFRVDTDTITLGGCGNSSNLAFRPRRGSQLGFTPLIIQGPCFNNISEENIRCRFGQSTVVNGIILDEFQAMCLTPFVSLADYTDVSLSLDGGVTFNLFPQLFTFTSVEYGFSSTDEAQVRISNQTGTILTTGNQVTLEWYFSDTTISSWPNETMALEVQMLTVQLNESNGGITQTSLVTLRSNLLPRVGFQSASVIMPPVPSSSNLPTIYFRLIARQTSSNQIYLGLNSALFVLHDAAQDTSSSCYSWAASQPLPSQWNGNLLPCPLTLAQARVARCCYEADPLCNDYTRNSSVNCELHRGRANFEEFSAVACYRSRLSNEWHAASECCYESSGQLITRGLGAGTDDRFHPTTHPIQHYFSDTLPYFACCLLSASEETCARYFTLRPPRRGSNSPSGNGGTWGDPHFTTLDGSTYTFNGFGEYTYLALSNGSMPLNTPFQLVSSVLNFHSQIRTTPLSSASDSATVIRGFAGRSAHPSAQPVSVTVSRRELPILRRGNETIELDDGTSAETSLVLFYPELTLEYNRTSRLLTLSWFVGVSVQIKLISISNGQLILNLAVSLSGSYQHRTFGLLGVYDQNPANDLRTSNGTILPPANSLTLAQIHQQFGQPWSIDPSTSLFYYESGDSAAYYRNQNSIYAPSFASPEPPSSQLNSTLLACDIDSRSINRSEWTVAQQTCFYDIATSNDTRLGQTSRLASEELAEITVNQRYPPEFAANLPLTLTVNQSASVVVQFTAVSPYSSIILYQLLQGPSSASFDNATGRFQWPNPASNDTVVRVSARDTRYNLLSTHELVIHVLPKADSLTSTPPLQPSSSIPLCVSSGLFLLANTLWASLLLF